MMTKETIYSTILLILLTACQGVKDSNTLDQIDSLVVKEQYESACQLLDGIDNTSLTSSDYAHYCLLKTQIAYLTRQPLPSDTLLDIAVAYYSQSGNQKKLADANVYKSYRLRMEQNYPQAIRYGKEAERLAVNTDDARLDFKIADNLAYLNGLCENDLLQLEYAKKALRAAQKVGNNNWMLYSYNKISYAFYNLGQQDSAYIFIEKSVPYLKYVYDADKAACYTNIALLYKESKPEKAKEYLEKALNYDELPETIEHLADIYYAEGNREEAYKLWRKALTKDSRYKKDNLIHSILAYDLECGNLEETSKKLDDIIAIKDSMLYLLRNDSIKDLQWQFDHEVAMHEADRKLINAQWLILAFVIVVSMMVLYIFIRRKKEETLQKEHQIQLFAYTTEIKQLEAVREHATAQIKDLESHQKKNSQKIKLLEEKATDAELTIESLNKSIRKLLDDESPKLKQGRMLYDHIVNGGTAVNWHSQEETLFNNYYAATNYQSYNRLRKVKRNAKLSAHNMFYLILTDMGKSNEEIRNIMALSPEGLRTLRHRTKPKDQVVPST